MGAAIRFGKAALTTRSRGLWQCRRVETQWQSANAHLVEELERRQREKKRAIARQRILAELIRAADDANRDIECVAAAIGEALRVELDIERVAIWRRSSKNSYQPLAIADCDPLAQPLDPSRSSPFFDDYNVAMARGEPMPATDVTVAPHLAQTLYHLPPAREAKSRLDIPILRDGLLDGMLICTTRKAQRDWSQEDVMFAAAVSNVVSILLERRQRVAFESQLIDVNTKLVAEADRRDFTERAHRRRQALMAELVRIIGDEITGDADALKVIAEKVREDFNIDRVAIWLYGDDEARHCIGAVAADVDPTLQPIDPHPIASHFPKYLDALRLGQPLLAPDVANALHLTDTLVGLPAARLAKSRLDVPIMRDGRFTGMIIFGSRNRRVDWTSEDAMFGAAVASIVAILVCRSCADRRGQSRQR